MIPPEVIKRDKGGALKPPDQKLPLAEPIPEDFMDEEVQVMEICTNYWYHRYQEEKNMLRGYQETSFNYIMDIRSGIVRELKEGTREDYVGPIWEGVCMAKNGSKKGVTLDLQAKEGLEHLKDMANIETENLKVELRLAREGA